MTTVVTSKIELSNWAGTTNLTFGSDFTISDTWTPLNINASVTINGNNRVITINIADFPGLFLIPISSSTISIQDINTVHAINSSIASGGGGIVGTSTINNSTHILTITNCCVTGAGNNYMNDSSGGIIGSYSKNTTITNCVAKNLKLTDNGYYVGGICGAYGDSNLIRTCCSDYSPGNSGGGICGGYYKGIVDRCYSTGTNVNYYSGGIVGTDLHSTSSIKNCYSTGNISGMGCGGITGASFAGTITNCYVYGLKNGTGAGLLVGSTSGGSAYNCYTLYTGNYAGINSTTTTTDCKQATNNTWNTTDAFTGCLLNTLSPDSNIWSDTNLVSPPLVSNAPFLLTVFTKSPFINYSFNQIVTVFCMAGTTLILMGDMTTKQLQDIERGDIVLEDLKTKKTNMVARLYKSFCPVLCYKIPKNLIGNSDDLIINPGHMVWCNSGKNRIRVRDIRKIKRNPIYIIVYNIQL